ncbi:Mov34/MPN/PAD-1 family protein [Sphingomonas flavalba]|uniref:Mov34/MPN/PAD-1 family protein n=1 Tax=Sphingomonas flavalba TaxID=2559804 RepID=UPI0039E1B1F6
MTVTISSAVLADIRARAAAEPDREVCGILTGADRISAHVPTANVAAEPHDSFEIDPVALFAAIRAERAGGPPIAGYYHSHPSGSAVPSARDRAAAAGDGRLWLIVGGGEARLWRAEADGFVAVALVVV